MKCIKHPMSRFCVTRALCKSKFSYIENGVTVTQARFVAPGQTFAMQGITSVAHNVSIPPKKSAIVPIVFGVILALISIAMLPDTGGIVALLIGLGAILIGIVRFRALTPDHQVVLNASTTASTQSCLESKGRGGGSGWKLRRWWRGYEYLRSKLYVSPIQSG